ncbi:hypothetical protein [Mycolicibacterium komossense]|uniref:Mammalian cell entry protein n=1 Tax=Mycolicibacterium komossense TaxID=1779 RepID=A0ABT3C891_9MYCO|nr:hypothetical protein [Mycolicibacterium komossense]MCV7225702.1 hypothetical protein [Mycolicibacterium komossense]
MPEADDDEPGVADSHSPVFSRYGIVSTVLAVVSVVAVVLVGLIWKEHRSDVAELRYRTDVMQTAADWTGVLINMNSGNVEASLQKLHDGTVGELNADFETSVAPYRDVVQTLQSRTTGQIQAVALESVHHDLDTAPGTAPPTKQALPPGLASRTDTVLVIASSVSENVGGTPQTVRWNLRLDVSDVDGKLLISRLESMR